MDVGTAHLQAREHRGAACDQNPGERHEQVPRRVPRGDGPCRRLPWARDPRTGRAKPCCVSVLCCGCSRKPMHTPSPGL